MNTLEMMRRIRIRSWKDVAAILVCAVVYTAISLGLPKLFPNIPQKAANVIAGVAGVIVTFVMLFALDA